MVLCKPTFVILYICMCVYICISICISIYLFTKEVSQQNDNKKIAYYHIMLDMGVSLPMSNSLSFLFSLIPDRCFLNIHY